MGKTEDKRKIIEASIAYQEKTIETLQEEMEETRKGAEEESQELDLYESHRTQLYRKRDLFAKQLHQALEQMEAIKRIDPDMIKTKVEFGAIVITDKQNIVVATSIGKVDIEGSQYFTISPLVPFYKAMENLKKGDSFEFRDQKYVIKEVF
ncbi:MAG: hypothetical protein K9G67_10550 [Bacteroidales bacterium]|nr:hypothetical protein [Bacteroidales bacterium]MCF8344265.1 hypothetical protein [Bacteroidales bacterium]MCF8349904.1 hypothetical protein [Bacteroidales bacterium]MCF8376785.1 hypothetical protein [Bacteroidales bacterium]